MNHIRLVRTYLILALALLMSLVAAEGFVRPCALASAGTSAMDDLPPEGPPFGVLLDFDLGSHKKGETISLARTTGGHEGLGPECLTNGQQASHLHGNGLKVLNCNGFQDTEEGPFNDPNASSCGYGKVVPYRSDVSIDVVGPALSEGGGETLTYVLTVKNLGPHTANFVVLETGEMSFNGIGLNFTDFDRTFEVCTLPICSFTSIPVGGERTARVNLTAKRFVSPGLHDGILRATFSVRANAGCFSSSSGPQSADPVLSNNEETCTTVLGKVEAGTLPAMVKAFLLGRIQGHLESPALIRRIEGLVSWLKPPASSSPTSLLPDGTGYGFTPGQTFPVPSGFEVIKAAVFDFNNDGNQDVVFGGSNGGFISFPGQSNGNFGSPIFTQGDGVPMTDIAPIKIGLAYYLATPKFNSPPPPPGDFAPAALTGTLSTYKGKNSGVFQKLVTIPLAGVPTAIVTGDFNGDNKPDAAVCLLGATESSPGSVSNFSGDDAGNFSAAGTLAAGVKPSSITTGDFNNDNHLDLAVANQGSNDVSILLGDGAGSFAPAITVPVGTSPVDIVAGEFNGNGKLDLATANAGSNNVTILLGGGNGLFVPVNVAAGEKPSSLAAGDFNHDGKLDLAVGGSGDILILLNGATPVTRPAITGAEVNGKKLIVTGSSFDSGTVILVDGVEQATTNDSQNPTTMLISKKGGKKIKPGRTVLVQVMTSTGVASEALIFTRPAE